MKFIRDNIVACVILLVIISTPFIVISFLNGSSRPRMLNSMAQVNRVTQLYFPSSSLLVEGKEVRSLSPRVVAKVSMAQKDLKKFTSQKVISDNLIAEGCGFTEKDFPSGETKNWNLKSLENKPCLSGANRPGETGGFWMIIDEKEKDDALIYLYYQD